MPRKSDQVDQNKLWPKNQKLVLFLALPLTSCVNQVMWLDLSLLTCKMGTVGPEGGWRFSSSDIPWLTLQLLMSQYGAGLRLAHSLTQLCCSLGHGHKMDLPWTFPIRALLLWAALALAQDRG